MIISCPACATRYVVPDSAIGLEGRTVRCAKCRHSWFQEGQDAAEAVETPIARPAPASAKSPPAAEPTPNPPTPTPPDSADPETDAAIAGSDTYEDRSYAKRQLPPEPPAFAPRDGDVSDAGSDSYQDDVSQFDHQPPFRPRRNWMKLWSMAAFLFALVAMGAVAGISYWGLPDWVPINRPTFAEAQADLQLDFPANRQDRRPLPSGTEFFGASGTVTNIGQEVHRVPPILIVLRDSKERIVYSMVVTSPKRTLAPGETVNINEAVVDVPKSAKIAEIGWKPE